MNTTYEFDPIYSTTLMPLPDLWVYAIFGVVALSVILFTYFYFGSLLVSLVSANIILGSGVFLGLLPLWVAALFGVTAAFIFFTPTEAVPETTDYWLQYGTRLKEAYSAKFGGANGGFNDEVDKRIVVMQKLRIGFTHTLARDWLRRMGKFTEAKMED